MACSRDGQVAECSNVVGVLLLGSENPLSYNRDLRPPNNKGGGGDEEGERRWRCGWRMRMRSVHASGDRVVHPTSLLHFAELWSTPSTSSSSSSSSSHTSSPSLSSSTVGAVSFSGGENKEGVQEEHRVDVDVGVRVEFVLLHSVVQAAVIDCFGDDIGHGNEPHTQAHK